MSDIEKLGMVIVGCTLGIMLNFLAIGLVLGRIATALEHLAK